MGAEGKGEAVTIFLKSDYSRTFSLCDGGGVATAAATAEVVMASGLAARRV